MSVSVSQNLAKIDHVVVLMMENRSFDHLLGWLSLTGGRGDVEGLKPEMANTYQGQPYPVHHLTQTALADKDHDLDHSGEATARQINGGAMDGFVESYAAVLAGRGVAGDVALPMGYFDSGDLPVFAHMAQHFAVCDCWHSSVPGATWPNRLYAVTGRADGSRDDRPHPEPPIYDKPSFVRQLDAAGVSWRWYSYGPGTLRCADGEYLVGHYEHFAFVDRVKLRWDQQLEEGVAVDEDSASFLQQAALGTLPSVSWIDPNFHDLNLIGSPSNDDHPPSDVLDGQELIFRVYNALASGPNWDKTLLIITYDEHGGFYDHVKPPEAEDDDPQLFGQYGVRVPALIVSPWVAPRSVSHTLYDHTSIIKTILQRFCSQELAHLSGFAGVMHWLDPPHPHYMGKRVAQAADLGELLVADQPTPAPQREDVGEMLAKRRGQLAGHAVATPPTVGGDAYAMTDLQLAIATASDHLRSKGLQHGQP